MRKLLLTLALISLTLSITAQENTYINYKVPAWGIYGGLNFNSHSVDFQRLPGTYECCNQYEKGSGMGPNFGVLYSMPLADFLMFDLRLGYFSRNGIISADEPVVLNYNGNAVNGIFEHSIDAGIASLALEPVLGFKVFSGLKFNIGLNAGFLFNKTYELSENIKSPSDGTFENNQRTRLVQTGDIEESSALDLSPLAGLSYDIPLDSRKEWYITPEVSYYFGLTDILNENKWKINTLRAGIALKYAPWDELIEEEEAPAPYPYLKGKIRAVGLSADSVEKPVLQFVVEEFISSELKPLLTYIFFDNNSDRLRDKYIKLSPSETQSFSEKGISTNATLDVYYNVLNIIGSRMQKYPEAKINIEGCNSNNSTEKDNLDLSERRAKTVYNYLRDVWQISPDRLSISRRNLPQEPSNPNTPDGIQENQRVEITTNMYEIIAPVMVNDTFRTVNPPVARFYPEVETEAGLQNWKLHASQNNTLVNTFSGDGELPQYVEWVFEQDQKSIPKSNEDLKYRLTVTDRAGQVKQTETQTLPVDLISIQKKKRERVKDYYVDRYSLILFSFDKAKLSFYNEKLVNFIKERSKPNSRVHIKGHTDRMGDDAHNLKLSKERAETVGSYFTNYESSIDGYGETRLIYNNDLPEGRFYSRRVDVVVETPVSD